MSSEDSMLELDCDCALANGDGMGFGLSLRTEKTWIYEFIIFNPRLQA